MGDDVELRQRVGDDERATLARIEALQAQVAVEQRHLAEVRLFQSMLNAYAAGTSSTGAPVAVPAASAGGGPVVGDAETEAGLSAAQAEELERLNRLFGLNTAS